MAVKKNPDEVVVKILVRREVNEAYAAVARRCRISVAQLQRELLAYVVGGLEGPVPLWVGELGLDAERLKTELAPKAPPPPPQIQDADGNFIPEAVAKLTVEDVYALDEAVAKALHGKIFSFPEPVSQEVEDAVFARREAMKE